MKKSLFLIAAAAALLFGCKNDAASSQHENENAHITITVRGDEGVMLKGTNTFTAPRGAAWGTLKLEAEGKLDCKDGFKKKEWRFGSAGGTVLTDAHIFNSDSAVFAVTQALPPAAPTKITITVKGDTHAKPALENTFQADKGTPWRKIELVAESKITNDAGFTRDTWKFNGADGAVISSDYKFNADAAVFAVSKAGTTPAETVTITFAGDAHVVLPPPRTFPLEKGKTWAQVKALAETKVGYQENYEGGGWKLTDAAGAALTDDYTFTADTKIFANSKPIMITISVEGDDGAGVPAGASFAVQKGSEWSALKEQAKEKVNCKAYRTIKNWRLGGAEGEVLSDTHTFTADETVYAETESTQIMITVKGDSNVKHIKNPNPFTAEKGVKWSVLKSEAEKKVTYDKNFENKDWKLSNADGLALTDDYQFNEDAAVFAESKPVMVTITLTGGHVTISEPKMLHVAKGTKWKDVKPLADAKIRVDTDYTFTQWQMNNAGGRAINEMLPFGRDTTIYAATKAKFITVTIEAGVHVTLKSGEHTIRKPTGEKWENIKVEAQAKIDKTDAGYIFSAWKENTVDGKTLADVDTLDKDTVVYATAQPVPAVEGVKVAGAVITGKEPSYPLPGTESDWKGAFPAGRTVKLSAYTMGKHEVTVQLWKEVYGWAKVNGYTFDFDDDSDDNPKDDDKPMANISWRDCIAWCNAYTEMRFGNTEQCVYRSGSESGEVIKDAPMHADTAYCAFNKKGYRLPTEAEWEYAARYSTSGVNAEAYGSVYLTKLDSASGAAKPIGFSGMTLPSGETYETLLAETARVAVFNKWWNGSKFMEQTPPVTGTEKVGSKAPNKLGIYDMSGNVGEWCWDLHTEVSSGTEAYFKGPLQAYETQHVVRGGGWSLETENAVYNCTVGMREKSGSSTAQPIRGFRLAWSD